LAIWRARGFREGEAGALTNLGFLYDYSGDYEKALSFHNQALPLYRVSGDQTGEAMSLFGLARATFARGNADDALEKMETAVGIIESIRTRIAAAELRASYLAKYQSLYQFYVDLLMRLNQTRPSQGFDARAFQASERARARSLLDILNEARADLRQGVEPALLERERKLQQQLNAKDQQRRRARDARQSETIDKEIRALNAAFQELRAEIKSASPRYAALTQTQPASLKEIQSALDAETVLLAYWLGEWNSYLWLVTANAVKSYRLPKRADLEAEARLFYDSVKTQTGAAEARKAAVDLSKILLEPAASELGNKRLLIVADGALNYVPFAALTAVNGQKTENRFLVETNEIVYLPSASILTVLRQETGARQPAPKTIAVLADPVFDLADPRVARSIAAGGNGGGKNESNKTAASAVLQKATRDAGLTTESLPRLANTREEAATIQSLVAESEIKLAMNFAANRATAISSDLAQYRIVHFATHGLLDSRHPELSGIALSMVDEQGKPQDGFLRLHEIYNLRLPADLIVLSACQTALGKDIKGEGLIGLTRGFMYAGAQRVAASLWKVDDEATAKLMQSFYQGMLGEKKLRPAAALREAQITMLKNKNFAAPYFWSAFTIQGEWR
jgi:CHAT domain-containing protein